MLFFFYLLPPCDVLCTVKSLLIRTPRSYGHFALFTGKESPCICSLRSMAVLSSRAQERRSHEKFAREARENERRSREKNKNRLPGFVAFSTAAPFNSF